jgi:hypothetical protein
MSNKQTTPLVDTQTIANAAAAGGSFIYNMQGIGRASLQLNATLSSTNTDVITLTISNDGVIFNAFSSAKTVTFTGGGTLSTLFELGSIDYAYLKVSFGTPSGGTVTLVSILYGVDGRSAF